MRRAAFACAVAGAAALACSQEFPAAEPRNLDRPTDLAFACVGGLVLDDGSEIFTAQPLDNCFGGLAGGGADAGPSPAVTPGMYGFALQSETGTVAVVDMSVNIQAGVVIDSDPLVPGKNSLPVGSLPVSIATDETGCFLTVANAGTCDLSIVDPVAAVQQQASVRRAAIVTAAGDVLRARPRMMATEPPLPATAQECPAEPTGLLYVAYPACHAVAVIDPTGGPGGTGYGVVASIRFGADGTPVVAGGDLDCPVECGDARAGGATAAGGPDAGPADAGPADAGPADAGPDGGTDSGAPRPGAVLVAADGSRLFIGAENAAALAVVSLDDAGLPTSATSIPLEGPVGLRRLAETGVIYPGGARGNASFGNPADSAGAFRFVYGVGTDRSIRVVDVTHGVECDTQVDPRYLHDVTDRGFLACMPVGDSRTPPRRAGARGPGIRFPRDASPLDVAIYSNVPAEPVDSNTARAPLTMVGTFAMVTTSDGLVHVVNVDDDHYLDSERSDDPLAVDMPLAIPHQPRDAVTERSYVPTTCSTSVNSTASNTQYGVRARDGVAQLLDLDVMSFDRSRALLPVGRRVLCELGTESTMSRDDVSELEMSAPPLVREYAFPDVLAARNEEFVIAWEGQLSLDDQALAEDGPTVRVGVVLEDGDDVLLVDGAAPFCGMGVQEYDVVTLMGCSSDANCSVGEECVFHPDSTVSTGLCFPAQDADALLHECRDLLVSQRRYTAVETYAGHLTLAERLVTLLTTPLDGCDSDAQCADLARYEQVFPLDQQPKDDVLQPSPYSWACVSDPSRAPGPKRCVMTCDPDAEDPGCADGAYCNRDGLCTFGPLPTEACTPALQRYRVNAGEAFTVIGAAIDSTRITGYLHNRIVDPATGQCIDDPAGNPLHVGRIPLRVPPCSGDGLADVEPNPCATTIDHTIDKTSQLVLDDSGECVPRELADGEDPFETVTVDAIRFRNPVFTMHLVQVSTTGDAACHGDGQGGLPPFSPVFPGYGLSIRIGGGFAPMTVQADLALPVRIVPGPDGNLWILDAGDDPTPAFTRGKIVRVIPSATHQNFGVDPTAVIE
ncbi:MAG: hypothetical protein D6689_08215 [Deltaproteobacteria bacterium]|nr:MAG: hypothetical protein D6689_08215 [Deltaproteobacteria bacterium]